MAKQELVKIKVYDGEEPNSKIYVLSMSIKGLELYEKAKAMKRFIDKETKVLEQAIENDLRSVFISYGIIPKDGSYDALEESFYMLHAKGKDILIIDRYAKVDERIIGERNNMTVILEEDILSAAIEIEVIDYEN